MRQYLYSLATGKAKGTVAGILKFLLFLLALFYGLIIRFLMFISLFKPRTLGCKVISVGNITLGGTGKTSLVEFIARYLTSKGHKVAVLTRGYGRAKKEVGDEPSMLAHKLPDVPVIVDKDRIKGAKKAKNEHNVDTVILDDGMQQWKIKKDLEIVAIDARSGFGNCQMLPRGILREPLSSLKKADVFVLTKTNLSANSEGVKEFLNNTNPRALIIESIHQPSGFYNFNKRAELLGVDYLKGKSAAIFSGIGDPDSFSELIKNLGVIIGAEFKFEDHHNYSKIDLEKILCSAKEKNIGILITTEKDASRLQLITSLQDALGIGGLQLFVLRIGVKITVNEDRFYSRLLGLYSV